MSERLKVRFNSLGEVDCWIDCSDFSDRAAPGHCGLHTDMVTSIVDHYKFKNWIESVKYDVETVTSLTNKHTLNIVAVCTSGINRSPAAGLILESIFQKRGYPVNNVKLTHLSKSTWSMRNVCFKYRSCVNMDDKQKQFEKAFRVWNTA